MSLRSLSPCAPTQCNVDPLSYTVPLSYELLTISDLNLTAELSSAGSLSDVRSKIKALVHHLSLVMQESHGLLQAIERGNEGRQFDPFDEKRCRSNNTLSERHLVTMNKAAQDAERQSALGGLNGLTGRNGGSITALPQGEVPIAQSKMPHYILCYPKNGHVSYLVVNSDLKITSITTRDSCLMADPTAAEDRSIEPMDVATPRQHQTNLAAPWSATGRGEGPSACAGSSSGGKSPESEERRRGDYDPEQFSKFASFLTNMGSLSAVAPPAASRRQQQQQQQQAATSARVNAPGQGPGHRRPPRPRPLQLRPVQMPCDPTLDDSQEMDTQVHHPAVSQTACEIRPPSPIESLSGSVLDLQLSPTSLNDILASCPVLDDEAWTTEVQYSDEEAGPLSPTSQMLEDLTPLDVPQPSSSSTSGAVSSDSAAPSCVQGQESHPPQLAVQGITAPLPLTTSSTAAHLPLTTAQVDATCSQSISAQPHIPFSSAPHNTADTTRALPPPHVSLLPTQATVPAPPVPCSHSLQHVQQSPSGQSSLPPSAAPRPPLLHQEDAACEVGFDWARGLQQGSNVDSIRDWLEAAARSGWSALLSGVCGRE